jgi:ketosteroid isomerase-like protein
MKRRTTAIVILFALAAILILLAQANIHAGPAPQADAREVLMKADADFDAAVAAKGIEAWVATFAEDGLMFRAGEPVHGRPAIRELMAPAFATPGFSLRWQPVAADIAASGDLGYTYGTYQNSSPGADGKPEVRTGMYVTIWKKQADGSWKAVVDLGSSAPPPQPKTD